MEQKQFKECLKERVEKESELQACPSINGEREALILNASPPRGLLCDRAPPPFRFAMTVTMAS